MSEHLLIGLASIIVLGILAQWLAWRMHLPAILLLLIFGFIAGPVSGILHPDEVFGDLLFPLVSICVGIILFEGGLNLRMAELVKVGKSVRNLASIGVVITGVLASLGAHYIAGIEIMQAILLGSVLVVSGPTVIMPILRQIRPRGNVGPIIKWEGIVNDPIGAILAVLVFELILHGSGQEGTRIVLMGAIKSIVFGLLFGFAGAVVMVFLLRRYLIPDFLQNPVALMVVVMCFVGANSLQMESGLLAVTVMGIALANQKYVSIKSIFEFKENLRVLIISSLFIILAARIPLGESTLTDPRAWIFVAFLIIIARPVTVLLSTIGTSTSLRERLFLTWMAPRGIVAAAVVSVFAIRLTDAGVQGADSLVPLTFQVIIGTVAIYGLTAPIVGRLLGVSQSNPQGVLFGGAQPWVQDMALQLKEAGYKTILIDSNWSNIAEAREKKLVVYYGNILSENLLFDLNFDGIGRLLAMTPNDEVNALTVLHFKELFHSKEVYQLRPAHKSGINGGRAAIPHHLQGRYLFEKDATFGYLKNLHASGAVVKSVELTEDFDYKAFIDMYGETSVPLFIIRSSGRLEVCVANNPPEPKAGQKLICLVDEPGN